MIHELQAPLTFLAALGSGLMAGTFFAFSAFVMRALGRLPAEQGIAAMQSINVVVLNAVFLSVFLGTAIVCAVLAIVSVLAWHSPGSAWRLTGCLLYIIGCFFVTMAFNVPLNHALARVAAGTAEAGDFWAKYRLRWTAWNHVRTLAPLCGANMLFHDPEALAVRLGPAWHAQWRAVAHHRSPPPLRGAVGAAQPGRESGRLDGPARTRVPKRR